MPTVAKNPNPYMSKKEDPERRWLFEIDFHIGNLNLSGKSPDILRLNAQSVSLPTYSVDPIVVPHLNIDVKFAGRPTLGDLTVVFLTGYDSLDVIALLESWHNLIFSAGSEQIGLATNYKADGHLYILRPSLEIYRQYYFVGCWPSNIGDKEYDWSASENVTRTVMFQVDKVYNSAESKAP